MIRYDSCILDVQAISIIGNVVFIIEGFVILLIGLFSGAYGIVVGAGGGFILVPALLLIMHMSPTVAAGTGLVVVMINTISGVYGFIKQKRIAYELTLYIVLGAFPGSFIGIKLANILGPEVFYGAFAIMLILLGLFLFWKNTGNKSETSAGAKTQKPLSLQRKVSLILVGIVMGVVSTFFGIGGGWLMVPILIYLYRVAPHRATATSVFALSLYSIIGVMLHVYNGHVDWSAAVWGGVGALLGAQIGVFISNRMSGKLIVQLLSILLFVIGVRMLI